MPSRNDSRNDTGTICAACGRRFTPTGRRRWCSDACRQAVWRRRHPAPAAAAQIPVASRSTREVTVYECPTCEVRYLGGQRCDDCQTFCRRVGTGGLCPHCFEPVAIDDLIAVTA